MKICFISPYIPKHHGGGEKYLFDCARLLSNQHQVSVAIPQDQIQLPLSDYRQQYQEFLGQSLAEVSFVASPIFTQAPWWKKLWWTRQFDVLYYQTDGSLFFSLAKKNILHWQIPFTNPHLNLLTKLKLKNWSIKNSNSYFTQQILEKYWPLKIDYVHQPMVEINNSLSLTALKQQKQKIILNVGRFFTHLHAKRQDVLVDAFAQLVAAEPKLMAGWQLVLIGEVEDENYAQQIQLRAQNLPIKILHQVTRAELNKWYQRASIYWHATGYGINQIDEPAKVEHFGISTLEAMAAAAVPVVINKGGQPEVLGEDLAELLWDDLTQLKVKTLAVITDPHKKQHWQQIAYGRAQEFDGKKFIQILQQMINH